MARSKKDGDHVNKPKKPKQDAAKPSAAGHFITLRSTLAVLLVSVLFGVVSWVWIGINFNTLPTFNVTAPVTVKVLSSPDANFAQSCADVGTPVILKNSIATKWKASQWTPDYLEKKLDIVSGVYENNNRWFGPYFDKQKPLLSFAERKNKYKTNLKLKGKKFFQQIQTSDSNNSSFFYFTGDIDQLGTWALNEIEPFDELLTLNPTHSSINAWIGQPHVIAHCHYDGYHNFYAQLYGKKRFLLLRPTNWPGLYPYPFLHPSHAQAQVNVSNRDDWKSFPLVRRVEAFEAVLEPGDLLYVPPLWFHEVESLEVSISVNVWTDSKQTSTMERLFQLPLPVLAHKWTTDRTKWIATSFLLFQALQKMCTHKNCIRSVIDPFEDGLQDTHNALCDVGAVYFIHRLWSTRYRTLMERGSLPNSLPEGSLLCEGDWVTSEVDEAKKVAHTNSFGEFAQHAGTLVQELPEDTWELWIGNYMEFVVANVVPGVEYVGVFLKHFSSCLLVHN